MKFWTLPKEWRDAVLEAQEEKDADTYRTKLNNDRVRIAVDKLNEDSDEDDLAGWHIDWCLRHNHLMLSYYLRASFSKVRKCQIRRTLKDGFTKYMLENLDSFTVGLKANSLKYALIFGRNVSPLLPENMDLYR